MITAADDFATGIFQAIIGLRDAQAAALDHGRTDDSGQLWITDVTDVEAEMRFPEVDAAYKVANRLVDEAHARYPRVQLLFGVETRAEKAAQACVIHMRVAMVNLEAGPIPNSPATRSRSRHCTSGRRSSPCGLRRLSEESAGTNGSRRESKSPSRRLRNLNRKASQAQSHAPQGPGGERIGAGRQGSVATRPH